MQRNKVFAEFKNSAVVQKTTTTRQQCILS
jgi:hypothetical protein